MGSKDLVTPRMGCGPEWRRCCLGVVSMIRDIGTPGQPPQHPVPRSQRDTTTPTPRDRIKGRCCLGVGYNQLHIPARRDPRKQVFREGRALGSGGSGSSRPQDPEIPRSQILRSVDLRDREVRKSDRSEIMESQDPES